MKKQIKYLVLAMFLYRSISTVLAQTVTLKSDDARILLISWETLPYYIKITSRQDSVIYYQRKIINDGIERENALSSVVVSDSVFLSGKEKLNQALTEDKNNLQSDIDKANNWKTFWESLCAGIGAGWLIDKIYNK